MSPIEGSSDTPSNTHRREAAIISDQANGGNGAKHIGAWLLTSAPALSRTGMERIPMNQPNLPTDETVHSFVVRFWQEQPGQWRGAIRHVQSDARLAFLDRAQALRWMERYLGSALSQTAAPQVGLAARLRAWWQLGPQPLTVGLSLAGGLAVLVVALLLAPPTPATLAGTTVTNRQNDLIPFLFGLLIGVAVMAVWTRLRDKRG